MSFPDETQPLGVYCHVPFCPGGCDFCSFYRTTPRRSDVLAFLDGIEAEIALAGGPITAETLFFGGGTPGLLATGDLLSLCRTIVARLGGPPREWTVEMAPTTVKAGKMKALKEIGVTRISMGIQSFDADLLRVLGRRHTPERARAAFDLIREAGFENVNVDMIFALPGQTGGELDADLDAAAGLEAEHISAYCLTLEEGTPFRERVLSRFGAPDADREAELFLRAWDRLGEAGFAQYEISNFARPGRECRHNVNTWKMGEWIGLGPSAASQFDGRRYANSAGLEEWLRGVASGRPVRVDEVPLTARLLAEDSLVFGLRMNAGVRLDRMRRRFPEIDFAILEPLFSNLEEEGIVAREGPDHVALTRKGRLLADRVGVALLDRFEEAGLPEKSIRVSGAAGKRLGF